MAVLSAYGFDEGAGTTAKDASGNGHTLTATGTPWDPNGHVYGAAYGRSPTITEYFASATGIGPNASQTNYSVMFWVYCPTFAGTGTFTAWYTAIVTDQTFFVEIQGNGGAQGVVDFVCGGSPLYSPTPITAAAWHHIAGTRNSSGSVLTMYIDGVSVCTGTGTAYNFGAGAWRIGNSITGDEMGIDNIRVDDFRLFDTCLSSAEVNSFMNTPVNYPFMVTSPAASALYR